MGERAGRKGCGEGGVGGSRSSRKRFSFQTKEESGNRRRGW